MTNIEIRVSGAAAVKGKQDGLLTAGMVGATVRFSFDGLWDGLSKTAVFKCGGMVRDVIGVEDTARIPPEVLCPDTELYVGVEGRSGDGAVVIPTVWVRAAYVYPGANASGDPSTDPTLPVWAQMQAMIGDLEKLGTADKSSLVAAINEALRSGGGAVDEKTIARLVEEYLAAHPVEPGTPGMDGGYYTPNVMQSADGVATIGWEASREGMPEVEGVTMKLPEGPAGEDGKDGICTLPYGGSREWLEANGDPALLYQIDGYVWGYVESDGWTKSGTKFLVVSSESQMVNQGGTAYLLRSDNEGTVYAYSETSGDKDVPVYDALPETVNEGDIVSVGGRKYKAVLTETKVPAYTNRAVTLHEGYRYNSSGDLTERSDAVACEDVIPFSAGTVVRVKGLGKLDTVNCMGYGSEEALTVSASLKPAATTSATYLTYSYDAETDTATLVSTGSNYAVCLRIAGILSGAISDVVITVNEEITTKTETVISWTDIGEYVIPVEAGWNATDESYTVVDALSAAAEDGDIAVYSGDGYMYSYIVGAGWMAMSKYSPPTLSVDEKLSDTSTKAVQNKVVKAAIDAVDAKATRNANKIITLQNQVEALGGGASSETVTIPFYWEEMVAAKTETVKALQQAGGKNCVCFAWASDTHIPDEDPGVDKGYSGGRTTDLGKVMAKMMDDCEVPFAMLSGDINTRASYSTEAEYLETLVKVPVYLAPLWGTDRLLMAMGNHDGCWGDSTGYYRHQFTPERLWQVFFRGQALDFRRVFSENGLYYYVDNVPQKTRFIVLNSHFGGEYAEDENGWAVNNRFATPCYGQAQLDWLANVALDMPEGYGAVLTCHTPPKPVNGSTTAGIDSAQLNGIINAYCGKTTFSGSCTAGVDGWSNSEISVDFTDAKGEIIALFAGHIHWDTVDTTTLACPLITIISAGAPVNTVNLADGESAPVRYPWGTDQETSFDIVTINRVTRTIYCTRVGAGKNREVSY